MISKGFLMSSISSKKTTENKSTWSIIVVKSNSFVRFLEEIEEIKNLFEIIWPLEQNYFLHFSMRYPVSDCNYDGGDCCGSCVDKEFCSTCDCLDGGSGNGIANSRIGDGNCNAGLNNAECQFDGGDCNPSGKS